MLNKIYLLGQWFYMPMWVYRKITYVMRWTYTTDKNGVIIWIIKEAFTLFKYFFDRNFLHLHSGKGLQMSFIYIISFARFNISVN